jgi:hypothetical protein
LVLASSNMIAFRNASIPEEVVAAGGLVDTAQCFKCS